jgi:hypothetical protein
VRLFNATDVFGMALVRLPSGEPLARRVPPFLPSAHTEVEAGTFEVATTAGQVGPGTLSLARAWLDVSSGSRWLVIGLDGVAVVVADGWPGPGVRSLRFFNATTSPAWVRVAATAELYVEPGSESEAVDVGVGEFMAEFGREPGTVVAQAEFPAPGPSANWIALILPSSGAPLESELLVLDASGGYFSETLNPPD